MKIFLIPAALTTQLVAGCAAFGMFTGASNLKPNYDATSVNPVITQVHQTGTIAPPNQHMDTLVIEGNGTWRADRVFPYATATPSSYVLATGSLSASQVQALVGKAFVSPRFVDLPSSNNDGKIGGSTETITLEVQNGTKTVSVIGTEPAAFSAFDSAISAATINVDAVGPTMAGQ